MNDAAPEIQVAVPILTDEQKRRQRGRSLAIALSVGALVLIFYLITIFKIGPAVLDRAL
jgi:hypothetical protein